MEESSSSSSLSDFFLKFENVQLIDRANPKLKRVGSLHLKSSHLVWLDAGSKSDLLIYYSLIMSVEKQPLSTSGCPVLIRCKHFLTCLFVVSKERDCQTLTLTLTQYSKPSRFDQLLCFKATKQSAAEMFAYLTVTDKKKMFELESEYTRMGVPNNEWSLVDINANYKICDTYPSVLFAPSTAMEWILKGSASFRSRSRLPVLSYLHDNGASICRCAQPLTGLNNRCIEDEQLLQLILNTNSKATFMYIVDTRPKINAMANKAQGKGYENENNYSNIQFYFMGIENIHVMRNSLQKLVECIEPTSGAFLTGLDKSEWLKHIKAIIDVSVFIMEAVNDQNVNVIVHCSDGWDRLLLDPYYRTIHGFQILIEKEWLTFGHKFSQRCAHIVSDGSESLKESSPIFHQLLECVWQLTQQFPCAFEFNETFLIKLHEYVYSCQFGTFVGNCEKERESLKIDESTYSLWDYIQHRINDFINPLYKPNSAYSRRVIRPDTRLVALKFWRGLYNRFDANVNTSERVDQTLSCLNSQTICLNEYAKLLEKRCAALKALLLEKKDAEQTQHAPSVEQNGSTEEAVDEQPKEEEEEKKATDDNEDSNSNNENICEPPATTAPEVTQFVRQMSIKSQESVKSSLAIFSVEAIDSDVASLTRNWKSSRSACACLQSYDYASCQLNCSKCGQKYCERCVAANGAYVTSSVSTKLMFVCHKCLTKHAS